LKQSTHLVRKDKIKDLSYYKEPESVTWGSYFSNKIYGYVWGAPAEEETPSEYVNMNLLEKMATNF
jgi:hypothetical protein